MLADEAVSMDPVEVAEAVRNDAHGFRKLERFSCVFAILCGSRSTLYKLGLVNKFCECLIVKFLLKCFAFWGISEEFFTWLGPCFQPRRILTLGEKFFFEGRSWLLIASRKVQTNAIRAGHYWFPGWTDLQWKPGLYVRQADLCLQISCFLFIFFFSDFVMAEFRTVSFRAWRWRNFNNLHK